MMAPHTTFSPCLSVFSVSLCQCMHVGCGRRRWLTWRPWCLGKEHTEVSTEETRFLLFVLYWLVHGFELVLSVMSYSRMVVLCFIF